MSFAIDVCIKTAMLLVTASLLSWIARRASASLRHALWASALLAVLGFPLVVLVAPAINLVVLPAGFAASSVRPASVPLSTTTMGTIAVVQSAVASLAPAPAPKKDWLAGRGGEWTFQLALLWMSGCLVVLLQSILAFREVRRFKVRSKRPDDSWIAMFTAMRRELSLYRSVELRMSMNPGPLTSGIFRQVILLPAEAGAWPLPRRRLVLAHEMAHAKRRDGLGQLLCQLACLVYWFNPLVWYAVRQLRVERERACDDFVLGLGESAPDYADSLLQIARGLNAGIRMTAVSMACPSQLKSRMIAILDSHISRKRISKLATAALVFATAALTISVGAVRLTALEAMPFPIRLMPAPPEEPTPAQEPTLGYVANPSPTTGIALLAMPIGVGSMKASPEQITPGPPPTAETAGPPMVEVAKFMPQAQNQALAFEVASVKPANLAAGGQRGNGGLRGGGVYDIQKHRFIARNATLYAMIKWAYGVTSSNCIFSECDFLTGGPPWIRSDQFEVQAVMPDDSPIYTYSDTASGHAPAFQAMLQTMLVERFKVVVHREMKEMPVYLLTVAKGGPTLKPSKVDDKPALFVSPDPKGTALDRVLRATKMPMEGLVYAIGRQNITDLPVIDRTGLAGEFNFEIKFAITDNNATSNTANPSLFTALQEQIGLKLEAARAPQETFVIDSAEKPSEN